MRPVCPGPWDPGGSLTKGCAAGALGSLHGSQGQRGWDGLLASALMPAFRAVPGCLGSHQVLKALTLKEPVPIPCLTPEGLRSAWLGVSQDGHHGRWQQGREDVPSLLPGDPHQRT